MPSTTILFHLTRLASSLQMQVQSILASTSSSSSTATATVLSEIDAIIQSLELAKFAMQCHDDGTGTPIELPMSLVMAPFLQTISSGQTDATSTLHSLDSIVSILEASLSSTAPATSKASKASSVHNSASLHSKAIPATAVIKPNTISPSIHGDKTNSSSTESMAILEDHSLIPVMTESLLQCQYEGATWQKDQIVMTEVVRTILRLTQLANTGSLFTLMDNTSLCAMADAVFSICLQAVVKAKADDIMAHGVERMVSQFFACLVAMDLQLQQQLEQQENAQLVSSQVMPDMRQLTLGPTNPSHKKDITLNGSHGTTLSNSHSTSSYSSHSTTSSNGHSTSSYDSHVPADSSSVALANAAAPQSNWQSPQPVRSGSPTATAASSSLLQSSQQPSIEVLNGIDGSNAFANNSAAVIAAMAMSPLSATFRLGSGHAKKMLSSARKASKYRISLQTAAGNRMALWMVLCWRR